MKTMRKIDLFYNGYYLCTTLQAKTCKAAKDAYLERIRSGDYYTNLVDRRILKRPDLLKARFQK